MNRWLQSKTTVMIGGIFMTYVALKKLMDLFEHTEEPSPFWIAINMTVIFYAILLIIACLFE